MSTLKDRPELAVICAIFAYLLLAAAFAYEVLVPSVVLILICVAQNTAFSLVSRSRNRSNKAYHAIASVFSNGIWFATMAYMITELDFQFWVVVPYVLGTVLGSLIGVSLSMFIEGMFDMGSDDHLKRARALTIHDLTDIHRAIAEGIVGNRTYIDTALQDLYEKNQNGLVGRDTKGRFKKVGT